jgi:hydrogenase nickel incorporation protein HypB
MSRIVELRRGLLEKNDELAAKLRARFDEASVPVANWVSAPGTGKTALLETMLTRAVARGLSVGTLVGDCATDNDAVRLSRSGAQVRQIVTEGMCHLEADVVADHLRDWDLSSFDLLVIENVGNLVCPTGFDLGEGLRVALLSVTEGEDKPLKYPHLFHSADLVVITKTDLAAATEWDRAAALAAITAVNNAVGVVETSARNGSGIDELLDLHLGLASHNCPAPHNLTTDSEPYLRREAP